MKEPLQTALEKLDADDLRAVLELVEKPDAGAAAKLWVLEDALSRELRRQTGSATRSEPVTERDLKIALTAPERARALAMADIVEGAKNAMPNYDDPAFRETAMAAAGANQFYGDRAADAARNLDEGFFKSAAEACRVIKSRLTPRARQKATESRMRDHLAAALRFLRARPDPLETVTKQELEARLTVELGDRAFSDRSSWQALFRRPELAPWLRQQRGGGRPRGKNR